MIAPIPVSRYHRMLVIFRRRKPRLEFRSRPQILEVAWLRRVSWLQLGRVLGTRNE
jgi:hypothetical protein